MSAIELTKDFQTRVYDKIRNDFGSLLNDEDIKKLVETAIEREFFQPVKRNNGSYRDEYDPPKIQQLVENAIEPTLRKAIDQWVKDNQTKVEEIVNQALAGGLAQATLKAFDSILQTSMYTLQNNITQALQLTKQY